jgi:hypothetical protein
MDYKNNIIINLYFFIKWTIAIPIDVAQNVIIVKNQQAFLIIINDLDILFVMIVLIIFVHVISVINGIQKE